MRDEAGFTLIDATVASAVLAAGLLGLAQLLSLAVASNVTARHTTIAAVLASEVVEHLRSASAPSSGADAVDRWGVPVATSGGGAHGAFVRRWRVEPLAGSTVGTRIVHVEIVPAGRHVPAARIVTAMRPR